MFRVYGSVYAGCTTIGNLLNRKIIRFGPSIKLSTARNMGTKNVTF